MNDLYDALKTDIVDQVLEAQLKLGFYPETLRLYYTKDSLENLTGKAFASTEALCGYLSSFAWESAFRPSFSVSAGRICGTDLRDGIAGTRNLYS